MLAVLISAAALLSAATGAEFGVDWTSYGSLHEVHGEVVGRVESSLVEQVRDLPVSVFWDSVRATFRPALIGDVLSADLARFQAYLSTKASLVKTDGRLVSTNVTVVDTGRVYMETIVVIKALAASLSDYAALIRESRIARAARLAEVRRLAERVAASDWASAVCLASQTRSLEASIERADAQLRAYSASLPERLRRLDSIAEERRRAMAERNASLIDALTQRATLRLEVVGALGAELAALAEATAAAELQFSERRLVAEQELQLEAMRRSHTTAVEGVRLRVVEEHHLLREKAVHERRLMRIEHSFRLEAAKHVVDAVFAAARELVGRLLENPAIFLASLAAVVLAVVAVVVGLEVLAAAHLFLLAAVAGKRSAPRLRFSRARSPAPAPIADDDALRELAAMRSALRSEAACRPLLTIVSGGSGMGKTTALAHLCNTTLSEYCSRA